MDFKNMQSLQNGFDARIQKYLDDGWRLSCHEHPKENSVIEIMVGERLESMYGLPPCDGRVEKAIFQQKYLYQNERPAGTIAGVRFWRYPTTPATERPYFKIYVGIDTGEFVGRETEIKETITTAINDYLKTESLDLGLEIEIGESSRTKVNIIGECTDKNYIEECVYNLIGETQWDFLQQNTVFKIFSESMER
jgi:hypothetical protein